MGEARLDVVQWLHKKIAKLEEELHELYALQAILEERQLAPWPGEEVAREAWVGGKKIARVLSGEGYVRVIFAEPVKASPEIVEYLKAVEEMLKEEEKLNEEGYRRAKARAEEKLNAIKQKVMELEKQLKEEELIKLVVEEEDGKFVEIRFDNVSAHNRLDAEYALKEAAKLSYLLQLLSLLDEDNNKP